MNEADTTRADLGSGEPERIRSALRTLVDRRSASDAFEVALPSVELLDAFGHAVPSDVQQLFVDAVMRYPKFAGASEALRIATVVALILRHADRQSCFDFGMRLKASADPVASTGTAMREVPRQGLATPTAARGAGYLVSRMLDGRAPVRAAVLEQLRDWPSAPPYAAVIDYVTPQLEPDEIARLRSRDGKPSPTV